MDNFFIIPFNTKEYQILFDFWKALGYDPVKWAKATLLNAAKELDNEREEYKYNFN